MTTMLMPIDAPTTVPDPRLRRASRPTLSMLSPYPPTACGLSTFSASLQKALSALGYPVRMVRVHDGGLESDCGVSVAGVLVHGVLPTVRRAALVLSQADVAIIQHAFNAYGGRDGEEVLDVMRLVEAPMVSVLHDIPARPTPNQQRILEEIACRSAAVVALTHSAHARLLATYGVDADRIVVIPHGVVSRRPRPLPMRRPPQTLSWGLLRPGKGFETAIDAIALLAEAGMSVQYTIAGMTHPREARLHGERYRLSLRDRACDHGIRHLVNFDYAFRGSDHLARYVASSSVVVVPYDSTDQVVSGVLVDSIAARRPIIATRFPHACELLSHGAGRLVDSGDAAAMANALKEVLQDHEVRASMESATGRLAVRHDWAIVARAYARLADDLPRVEQPLIA